MLRAKPQVRLRQRCHQPPFLVTSGKNKTAAATKTALSLNTATTQALAMPAAVVPGTTTASLTEIPRTARAAGALAAGMTATSDPSDRRQHRGRPPGRPFRRRTSAPGTPIAEDMPSTATRRTTASPAGPAADSRMGSTAGAPTIVPTAMDTPTATPADSATLPTIAWDVLSAAAPRFSTTPLMVHARMSASQHLSAWYTPTATPADSATLPTPAVPVLSAAARTPLQGRHRPPLMVYAQIRACLHQNLRVRARHTATAPAGAPVSVPDRVALSRLSAIRARLS